MTYYPKGVDSAAETIGAIGGGLQKSRPDFIHWDSEGAKKGFYHGSELQLGIDAVAAAILIPEALPEVAASIAELGLPALMSAFGLPLIIMTGYALGAALDVGAECIGSALQAGEWQRKLLRQAASAYSVWEFGKKGYDAVTAGEAESDKAAGKFGFQTLLTQGDFAHAQTGSKHFCDL